MLSRPCPWNHCPWKRKDWQPMGSQKQTQKSQFKDLIFTNFFVCKSEFGKEGRTWNFTFLSQTGTIDRDLAELTGKNSHPLPAFCQFSQDQVCRLYSEWVVPLGPMLVTRNRRGGKIIFSLSFMVMVGWDLFSSQVPHKWISLSRLKVLHCGHYNLRLSLVTLTAYYGWKQNFIHLRPPTGPCPP